MLTILLIIADIPQELYSSYCDKHVVDSVYNECRRMAAEDYPADADAGTDYYLADWAYGVSLLNLTERGSGCSHKICGRVPSY